MADQSTLGLSANLAGQVAIVTGASRGLGKAVAVELARNGAKVACIARDTEKLSETVAEITQMGGQAEAFACDVQDRKSVDVLVDRICCAMGTFGYPGQQCGRNSRHFVAANVGRAVGRGHYDQSDRCFFVRAAASRHMMMAKYGRIINMASVTGIIGNAGQTNYAATKAGLIGLTRSLSRELAGRRVTVNAIAPGFIESDMTRVLGAAILEDAKKRIPAKRLGKPEDIAAAVLFLASPAASYITGQVLVVDGGMTS